MISFERAPAISVVMAVCNNLRYLPESVDSILSQTFRNFEFIIIDDGSTDGSGAWLERKASTDPRIRLYRQENIGLTKSLNKGLLMAKGEFIARMDGDDISLPERFAKQLKFMSAFPEVVASGTGVLYIDPKGLPLGHATTPADHEEIEKMLLNGNGGAICHPSVIMRRGSVEAVSGYDGAYRTAQDLDLYLRLGELGRLSNLPEILICYRQHFKSANFADRSLQLQNATAIVRAAMRRRNISGADAFQHGWKVASASECYQRWAWCALHGGRHGTAARYVIRSIFTSPTDGGNYRLLVYILRRKISSLLRRTNKTP